MKKKPTKPLDQQAFFDYMDGYCEAFDDLSDGAWQSCCMEGVESYNAENRTNIDPHEGWLLWVTKGESDENQ